MNQASATKARAIRLVRTDDSTPGKVKFYDRRETDVSKAFVAEIDVTKLSTEALHRAARHGITQNILDASNKLEGDERIAFIRKSAAAVQAGGWASAPVDEAKARETLLKAAAAFGIDPAAMAKLLATAK